MKGIIFNLGGVAAFAIFGLFWLDAPLAVVVLGTIAGWSWVLTLSFAFLDWAAWGDVQDWVIAIGASLILGGITWIDFGAGLAYIALAVTIFVALTLASRVTE